MFKKRLIYLVLIAIIAMMLVACGGGGASTRNLVEMQDSEAMTVLQMEISKFDVLELNPKAFYYGSNVYGRHYLRLYIDIKLKNEYINDYKLKQILSYELSNSVSSLKWNKSDNKSVKYELDRDKFLLIVDCPIEEDADWFRVLNSSYNLKDKPTPSSMKEQLEKEKFTKNVNPKLKEFIKHIRISLINLK